MLAFSTTNDDCCCCCCCSAYLSSCHRTASDANLLDDPHTFHHQDYFVIGGIRTCLGVSDDPMFLWISSNSCPLNLLLVRSHQAEIIIVKRLIQGRNSVTKVRVEPRSFDQGRRKNDALPIRPRCRRFVGYLVTDHSTDRALRIEQYSTWHGARVVSLGEGGTKTWAGRLLRTRLN